MVLGDVRGQRLAVHADPGAERLPDSHPGADGTGQPGVAGDVLRRRTRARRARSRDGGHDGIPVRINLGDRLLPITARTSVPNAVPRRPRPGNGLMVVYGHRILQAMADALERLTTSTGFQWDAANADKNWERHRVSRGECEQVFLGRPPVVAIDDKHSQEESRCYALGRTGAGRFLFIAFTIRGSLVRVISARDMSRKERKIYEAL